MLELILCTGDAAKVYPWSEYVENKDTENKKLIILRTLTCSNDQNLLQLYLKNSLYEESVGNEDIILVITAVVTNEYGFDLVRKFLNDNIHVILDR